MTTKEIIDQQITWAIDRITTLHVQVNWLAANRDLLEALEVEPQIFMGDTIDINNLTREKLLSVIKAIPGDWEKKPCVCNSDTIDYILTLPDGIKIRLYSAPPPPSCKVVEEEVTIPAQPERIEKRKRLVCS